MGPRFPHSTRPSCGPASGASATATRGVLVTKPQTSFHLPPAPSSPRAPPGPHRTHRTNRTHRLLCLVPWGLWQSPGLSWLFTTLTVLSGSGHLLVQCPSHWVYLVFLVWRRGTEGRSPSRHQIGCLTPHDPPQVMLTWTTWRRCVSRCVLWQVQFPRPFPVVWKPVSGPGWPWSSTPLHLHARGPRVQVAGTALHAALLTPTLENTQELLSNQVQYPQP